MTLTRRILHDRRRIVWPLGVMLAANLVALTFVVWPLRSALETAQDRSVAATLARAQAERAAKQRADAQATQVQAEDDLRRFYSEVLPSTFQEAETTTNLWLAEAAEGVGLIFRGSHFDWSPIRDTRLARATARITLEGSYAAVRRLLRDLETAEEFIIVERVDVADPGDQPEAAVRLQMALVVSTYFVRSPGP